MRIAAERARQGQVAQRTTYFGDQPWDQRACATLGFNFIAVGDAVERPVRMPDLSDRRAVYQALGLD